MVFRANKLVETGADTIAFASCIQKGTLYGRNLSIGGNASHDGENEKGGCKLCMN